MSHSSIFNTNYTQKKSDRLKRNILICNNANCFKIVTESASTFTLTAEIVGSEHNL